MDRWRDKQTNGCTERIAMAKTHYSSAAVARKNMWSLQLLEINSSIAYAVKTLYKHQQNIMTYENMTT